MQASIVDLRYRMKDVIRALDKNQSVTVLYRGKVKATIVPVAMPKAQPTCLHPFFGMYRADEEIGAELETVKVIMDKLRKSRY